MEEIFRLTTRDGEADGIPLNEKKEFLDELNKLVAGLSKATGSARCYRKYGKQITTIDIKIEEQVLAKKH